MIKPRRTAAYWFTGIVFSCGLMAAGGTLLKTGPGLHSAMPAGYDVVVLKPANVNLSLMGLIECPELEGAQHVAEGLKSRVVDADGDRLQQFPHHFSFRITASLRKIVLDGPASAVKVSEDPQELLVKLRFRVKAYHGLEVQEITPESVEMIGLPADVPYDERIYRVNVNIGNIPVTDRFVIEVISPEGELLSHFPFSLL
ncbi:MAG TPA: hypothetical protein VE133_12455 [Candidatus Sulfotelmatobacter sp.]|nr:hypothetical protein [Candidatus Sulfotelmatobacter sp.]